MIMRCQLFTFREKVCPNRLPLPLQKESILNLREVYAYGAGFVVVRHVVDPSADGKAPHLPSVVGL